MIVIRTRTRTTTRMGESENNAQIVRSKGLFRFKFRNHCI